ncbi:MAG: hypothetical protein KatS3mg130_0433 [Candidatus Sumerlaea sp.]|nr:MAG: hypothetical protein KatS3mg130_0433 [Candidatus Sumerlaea sp.]
MPNDCDERLALLAQASCCMQLIVNAFHVPRTLRRYAYFLLCVVALYLQESAFQREDEAVVTGSRYAQIRPHCDRWDRAAQHGQSGRSEQVQLPTAQSGLHAVR